MLGDNQEFSPKQETRLLQLVTQRLRALRHEVSDHLDRALPVIKLKPSASVDDVLVTTSNGAEWKTIGTDIPVDHGALSGLGDDDHPQYHNDARGDARYWPLSTDLATQGELDAHTTDTSAAHAASAVSFSPAAGIAATDVQGAIVEDAGDLAAHLADTTDAHAGSAITNTPAGSVSATTVQGAINELDSEKATTGSVTTVQANVDAEAVARAAADAALSNRIDPLQSDIYLAMDLAQDAIKEATDLDDATNRRIDFELDEKADRLEVGIAQATVDSHIANTAGAHAASAISIVDAAGYYTSTQVEGALQEVYLAQSANTIAAKYRGAWSASVQYATGDIVIFDGNSIIATSTPTLGATPVGNALAGVWDYATWDGTVWGSANGWTFLVAAGADGAVGADGSLVVSSADVFLAQDMALEAQKEAITLADELDRRIDFEMDEKADRLHRHDDDYLYKPATPSDGCVLTSDSSQVGGSKWALPGIDVWTTLFHAGALQGAGAGANTYILGAANTSGNLTGAATDTGTTFYFNPADYAVTGKTTQIRIVGHVANNATDDGVTHTIKLLPITAIGGAAGVISYTVGASIVDTGALNPAASGYAVGSSAATTAPSTNLLVMAHTTSGTMAASSWVRVDARIEIRHV